MSHRKTAFVLIASDHGSLIVSRLDWQPSPQKNQAWGIGCELLEHGCYQKDEVDCAVGLLELRRKYFGDGVLAIDGGANIGVHAVEWAKYMTGWGQVVAIEAQERVFYALAGNIALNNCFNACAIHGALSNMTGVMQMPVPDYLVPGSLGGLELKKVPWTHGIGQEIVDFAMVRTLTIDSLGLERCDLLKLDIEGMEMDALAGAAKLIDACHPILHVEHIKLGANPEAGVELLAAHVREKGYEPFRFGANLICVHRLDKCLDHVRHLHKTLMRAQIGAADMSLEWQKFERPADWDASDKDVGVIGTGAAA